MYPQIKTALGGGDGVLLFPMGRQHILDFLKRSKKLQIFETARLFCAHIALNREKYQLGESS
jgi:hypothetical protein